MDNLQNMSEKQIVNSCNLLYTNLQNPIAIFKYAKLDNNKEDFISIYVNDAFKTCVFNSNQVRLSELVNNEEGVSFSKNLAIYKEVIFKNAKRNIIHYNVDQDKYYNIQLYKINDECCSCMMTDITNEIKANISLLKINNELDQNINRIPGGIVVFRIIGMSSIDVDFCSRGLSRFLGYSDDEFVKITKSNINEMIYYEDITRTKKVIQLCLKNKETIKCNFRVYHKDGSLVWLKFKGVEISNNDNNPVVYGIFMNVSATVELYENIIDQSSDGIYVIDEKKYDILYMNEKMFDLIQKPNRDFIGKKCYSFIMNRESPCENCKMKTMNREFFCKREVDYKGRHLIVKGKRIEWNGLDSHIEFVTDDTERYIAHQKMIMSKESMKAAIEQADLDVWEYDLKNNNVILNKINVKNEMVDSLLDNQNESTSTIYINEKNKRKHMQLIDRICKGEKSASCDLMLQKQHDAYWYNIQYTTIFDHDNKPVKAFGSATNITEKKQIELKFEEEVSRRSALERNLLALGCYNVKKNRIIEFRSFFCDISNLCNYNDGTLFIKQLVQNYIVKEDQSLFLSIMKKEVFEEEYEKGNENYSVEYRIKYPNGSIRWVRTTIDLIQKSTSGDLIGYFYSKDINDEKITKSIINKAIEINFDYIIYIDGRLGSYKTYKNNHYNIHFPVRGMYNRRGFFSYIDKYIEEEKEHIIYLSSLENIKNELETKDKYYVYYTMTTKSGEKTKKKNCYTYLDKSATTIMCVTSDITNIYEEEQQKNEILKVALQNSQQAYKAKTHFLSNMSHDLRTPINAIVGMSHQIVDDIDNKDKIMEYVKVINTSSDHLLSLINDVLDMSKIESGKMEFAEESVNITKQISRIEMISKPMFEKKKQSFHVFIQNLKHNVIIADSLKMNRIIINLLNNANKFTSEGGNISLTIKEVPSKNKKYANISIIVQDDGIGIPKGACMEVFKPFVRGGNAEYVSEGTGLGLSIVKSIVESSGGVIQLKSKENIGTVITVDMPFVIDYKRNMKITKKLRYRKKISTSNRTKIDLTGKKVLVVEDNFINQVVAKRIFEKLGATVVTANNGKEGYELFANSMVNEYQIIFMDIQMPVMNGYESARAIRNSLHPQAANIPIIAMTANVFPEDEIKSFESGMNAHLGKPIDTNELAMITSQLLL